MPEPTYQPNVPDILLEAPVPPKRSRSFYAALVLAAVVLAWSIHGAKIRPGELIDGIPQIANADGHAIDCGHHQLFKLARIGHAPQRSQT